MPTVPWQRPLLASSLGVVALVLLTAAAAHSPVLSKSASWTPSGKRTGGVLAFSMPPSAPHEVTPYCDIFRDEASVTLRGIFPDEPGRLLVVDATRSRFPGQKLVDESEVDTNAKDATWIPLLPAWLDEVESLDQVSLHVSRQSVRVSGFATTFEKKASVSALIRKDVSDYVDAIEVQTPAGRLQAHIQALVEKTPIEFLSEQSELTPEGEKALEGISGLLRGTSVRVEIEGHTDNSGRRVSNLDLSEARAAAVRQKLIAAGFDRTRIVSKGFGADRPIADNETEAGRRKNRRIDFRIR